MSSPALPLGRSVERRWRTSARRQRWNTAFRILCLLALVFATGILVVLIGTIVRDGIGGVTLKFLTSFGSQRPSRAGIQEAIVGSLLVVGLSAAVAMPVGIAAAVYLQEFVARQTRFTAFLRLNIANLAGVPSIIYGLLGLGIFVRTLALGQSVVAGALTMAVLILPTVILVTQEALAATPRSLRDAALALGCSRWQTIRHHVLPAAFPGIVTGVILSVSRAFGESAPLIAVGAVGYVGRNPSNPLVDKFTALPLQIFSWTESPIAKFHDRAASAIVVLIAMLLLLNSVAIVLRARASSGAARKPGFFRRMRGTLARLRAEQPQG